MYGTSSDSSSNAGAGGANQRYTYLVGRLRNRQITMEEATELFTLMQAMLARANEAARVAAYRAAAQAPPAPAPSAGALPAPRGPPAPASSDDFLLVGLLAMGAGAGLLAALSKRLGDAAPPAPAGGGRPSSGATTR